MSKWAVFNRWVDGTHFLGFFPTKELAREKVRQFIGHLDPEYKRGENTWASDDGDRVSIVEVPETTTEKEFTKGLDDFNRRETE